LSAIHAYATCQSGRHVAHRLLLGVGAHWWSTPVCRTVSR
jgi:hypothetical protein